MVYRACLSVVAFFFLSLVPVRAQDASTPRSRPDEPYHPLKFVLSTDQAIQQFQEKVRQNPHDHVNSTLLGQAYIRKARETGDFTCYDRAEAAVRHALELRKDDVSAQATLAQVLCANHKFADGLKLAQRVYEQNPKEVPLLMLIGDAHLELGNYSEAQEAYEDLARKDPTIFLLSRRARLAELKGRTEEAIALMQRASDQEAHESLSKVSAAWYQMRLGEMNFNAGRLDEAGQQYEKALRDHPQYPAALGGLARVRAAQSRYGDAVDLYKRAIAINGTLPMLAELGDIYQKQGELFLARLCYDKLEQAGKKSDAHDRDLSLFYADHDRNLPQSLELAQKELTVRKDIYAYDTLAWALYKNDRVTEAARAMAQAQKLGTQDPSLLFHAGLIYNKAGLNEEAKRCLTRLQTLNPNFSVLHAGQAEAVLSTIH